MKKYSFISIMLIFFELCAIGQTSKIHQSIVNINGENKIKYNNQLFDINYSIVTITTSDFEGFKKSNNYNIIRKNKLGFIDLKIPKSKNFQKTIQYLIENNYVKTIEYSSFGKYSDFIPNDEFNDKQWYLENINMHKAWNIIKGKNNIIFGVLDSGTDWEHNDLGKGYDNHQNICINSLEDQWLSPNNPNSGNGIDDDNNR